MELRGKENGVDDGVELKLKVLLLGCLEAAGASADAD